MTHTSRARGALIGLAVGDAVGTTLEFRPPGTFTPITDLVGGGPFHLQPGEWTDDTSMALCLAESLVERGGFDAHDQMQRYARWIAEWRMVNGEWRMSRDAAMCGCPAFSTVHSPFPILKDACIVLGHLIAAAIAGADKPALRDCLRLLTDTLPLHPEIAAIAGGSFLHKTPPAIQGKGYVVPALEAALWAFWTTNDYRACVLAAANLGDDADTTAAIAGQLAGAAYGEEGIPADWRAALAMGERISALADGLVALAAPHARPR